eukprot:4128423-Alexandrium_andersonii.AAC.2
MAATAQLPIAGRPWFPTPVEARAADQLQFHVPRPLQADDDVQDDGEEDVLLRRHFREPTPRRHSHAHAHPWHAPRSRPWHPS